MIDAVTSLLQFLLSSAGVLVMSEAGSAAMWAVVLAAAIVFVLSSALAAPDGMRGSILHPPRAIDTSVAVTQSDPNAPGHARSRAPGAAAAAA